MSFVDCYISVHFVYFVGQLDREREKEEEREFKLTEKNKLISESVSFYVLFA